MKLRTATLSGALVASAVVVFGPARGHPDEKPVVDLSGRWTFNKELSDDAREKMRQGMEGRGGPGGGPKGPGPGMGGAGGGRGGPPGGGQMGLPPGSSDSEEAEEGMRAIFEPAEELTISETEGEIVIQETYGRTRTLHPNGKPYKTDNGLAELKTRWKGGKLVVEKKNAQGERLVETWELVADRGHILVDLRISGGFGPPLSLKRVYDRAGETGSR